MQCTSDVFLLAQKVILRLCRSDIRTSCEFWGIELLINNCGRHSLIRTHTHSMPTYTRNLPIQGVLINGMCLLGAWRRKAPTASSAKLASHTRLLATIVTCANCLLFALVLLFPFTQKTALSSYISHYRSLVFCVWKPCGCSTSEPISVVLFIGERVA